MASSRKKPSDDEEEDNGETIADMNIDGMPWFVRRKYRKDNDAAGSSADVDPLTKEEENAYRWAAVKAGLLIALVFGVVFFLFIAFCDFVWFK